MPKLILKFEDKVLREVSVGSQPVTIGRGPDNDLHVDNLAVSTYHAKIFIEEGRLVIEDLNSLNGTFVNNQKIQRSALRDGDSIMVGKHHIVVHDTWDAEPAPGAGAAPKKVVAPKIQETMVLDSKKRQELLQQAIAAQSGTPAAADVSPAPGSAAAAPRPETGAPPRPRIGKLMVLDGKTDQREYMLTGKLIVIGKSEMATVKMTGWFKPKVAAQINRRDDGYYLAKADKVPTVNGQPVLTATKLNDGDVIEVAGVRMSFSYSE